MDSQVKYPKHLHVLGLREVLRTRTSRLLCATACERASSVTITFNFCESQLVERVVDAEDGRSLFVQTIVREQVGDHVAIHGDRVCIITIGLA